MEIIRDIWQYFGQDCGDSPSSIKSEQTPFTVDGDPTLYFPVKYSGCCQRFKGYVTIQNLIHLYHMAQQEPPQWAKLEVMKGRSRPVDPSVGRGRRSRRRQNRQ